MSKISRLQEIGTEVGALCAVKNEAYGDSFAKCGEFLLLLFPDGIKPDQYTDALGIVRVFDKMMRIATAKDALGENPWRDIAGYGILGAAVDESEDEEGKAATDAAVQDVIDRGRVREVVEDMSERIERRAATGGSSTLQAEMGPTSLPLPPPMPRESKDTNPPRDVPRERERLYRLSHYWGGIETLVETYTSIAYAADGFHKHCNEYEHGYLELLTPSGHILESRAMGQK